MKLRLALAWWGFAVVVNGVGFSTRLLDRDPWALLSGLALAASVHLFTVNVKEYRRGRHRQAQENPRDPGDEARPEGDTDPHNYPSTRPPTGIGMTPGQVMQWVTTSMVPGQTGVAAYWHGTDLDAVAKAPDLPRSKVNMPILAHRIAKVRLDGKAEPFTSLNFGHRFGVAADAVCQQEFCFAWGSSFSTSTARIHAAPDPGCSCGFYALPADIDPWDDGAGFLTLQVELSGTVIEHERGYRAGHQRVLSVELPPCPMCTKPATAILVDEDGDLTRSCCDDHRNPAAGWQVVTIADLSKVLGVEVR